jgi:hypothetical protein
MNGYRFDYFCGWRYLMSQQFRNAMHDHWGRSLFMQALCYAGVIVSLITTSAATVLAVLAAWHLLHN